VPWAFAKKPCSFSGKVLQVLRKSPACFRAKPPGFFRFLLGHGDAWHMGIGSGRKGKSLKIHRFVRIVGEKFFKFACRFIQKPVDFY
jgi:hypothetical protein